MKGKGARGFSGILFLIVLLFALCSGGGAVLANEENPIDIKTTPNGFLFNTENLKPGDWMPRDIVIANNGLEDFNYIAKVGKSKSTKGLLEELELLVQVEGSTLFTGKLTDFKGFEPRKLAKGQSETLFFEVTMPAHLGNEFQGSKAEAEIIFLAEGDQTTAPGTGGSDGATPAFGNGTIQPKMVAQLPNTATNYYSLLFIGLGFLTVGVLILYMFRRFRSDS